MSLLSASRLPHVVQLYLAEPPSKVGTIIESRMATRSAEEENNGLNVQIYLWKHLMTI